MVITHSGVTDDLQGAENPKPPLDGDIAILRMRTLEEGRMCLVQKKRENTVGPIP